MSDKGKLKRPNQNAGCPIGNAPRSNIKLLVRLRRTPHSVVPVLASLAKAPHLLTTLYHADGFPRGSCLRCLPSVRVHPHCTASTCGNGGVAIALARPDEGKASAPACDSTRGVCVQLHQQTAHVLSVFNPKPFENMESAGNPDVRVTPMIFVVIPVPFRG